MNNGTLTSEPKLPHNSTQTNHTVSKAMYYEDIPDAIFYTCFTPMFLVGIVGNTMLIFIITKHKKMWTVPNRYILNASLADLLFIICSALAPFLDNDHFCSPTVCMSLQIVKNAGVTASLFMLTALSAERYHAIAYPLRPGTGMSASTTTTATILTAWAASFTIALSSLYMRDVNCTRRGSKSDLKYFADMLSVLYFLLTYITPLMIITAFYILMAQDLYLIPKEPLKDSHHSPQVVRLLQVKKKLAWVVLALVVTFALSFLPYYVSVMMVYFDFIQIDNCANLLHITFSITNVYACFNPIILYAFSEPCRRLFKRYLFHCFFKYPTFLVEDLSKEMLQSSQGKARMEEVRCTSV